MRSEIGSPTITRSPFSAEFAFLYHFASVNGLLRYAETGGELHQEVKQVYDKMRVALLIVVKEALQSPGTTIEDIVVKYATVDVVPDAAKRNEWAERLKSEGAVVGKVKYAMWQAELGVLNSMIEMIINEREHVRNSKSFLGADLTEVLGKRDAAEFQQSVDKLEFSLGLDPKDFEAFSQDPLGAVQIVTDAVQSENFQKACAHTQILADFAAKANEAYMEDSQNNKATEPYLTQFIRLIRRPLQYPMPIETAVGQSRKALKASLQAHNVSEDKAKMISSVSVEKIVKFKDGEEFQQNIDSILELGEGDRETLIRTHSRVSEGESVTRAKGESWLRGIVVKFQLLRATIMLGKRLEVVATRANLPAENNFANDLLLIRGRLSKSSKNRGAEDFFYEINQLIKLTKMNVTFVKENPKFAHRQRNIITMRDKGILIFNVARKIEALGAINKREALALRDLSRVLYAGITRLNAMLPNIEIKWPEEVLPVRKLLEREKQRRKSSKRQKKSVKEEMPKAEQRNSRLAEYNWGKFRAGENISVYKDYVRISGAFYDPNLIPHTFSEFLLFNQLLLERPIFATTEMSQLVVKKIAAVLQVLYGVEDHPDTVGENIEMLSRLVERLQDLSAVCNSSMQSESVPRVLYVILSMVKANVDSQLAIKYGPAVREVKEKEYARLLSTPEERSVVDIDHHLDVFQHNLTQCKKSLSDIGDGDYNVNTGVMIMKVLGELIMDVNLVLDLIGKHVNGPNAEKHYPEIIMSAAELLSRVESLREFKEYPSVMYEKFIELTGALTEGMATLMVPVDQSTPSETSEQMAEAQAPAEQEVDELDGFVLIEDTTKSPSLPQDVVSPKLIQQYNRLVQGAHLRIFHEKQNKKSVIDDSIRDMFATTKKHGRFFQPSQLSFSEFLADNKKVLKFYIGKRKQEASSGDFNERSSVVEKVAGLINDVLKLLNGIEHHDQAKNETNYTNLEGKVKALSDELKNIDYKKFEGFFSKRLSVSLQVLEHRVDQELGELQQASVVRHASPAA